MIAVAFAHHLSEGGCKILAFIVYDFAIDAALNHVAWLGRAVVVEEVITIYLVLRLQVFYQRLLQLPFFVVCQVQYLFGNAAAPFLVVGPEGIVGIGAQLIIG